MDSRTRFLQRLQDGELAHGEAAAAEALLRDDAAAAHEVARLRRLDEALKGRVRHLSSRRDIAHRDALARRIMDEVPKSAPSRSLSIGYGELGLSIGLIGAVGAVLALITTLAGTMQDVINLGLLAMISIAIGLALLVAAGPLRQMEASLLRRVMRRRIPIGRLDAVVYRGVGIALIVAGTWSLFAS